MSQNRNMKKLTKEWEELKNFFPEGWEEKAPEEQSDLSNPKDKQCGGTTAGGTAAFWRGIVLKGDKRRSKRRQYIRHIQRRSLSSDAKKWGMTEMDVRGTVGETGNANQSTGMAERIQSTGNRWFLHQGTGKYGQRLDSTLQLGNIWSAK